MAKFPISKDYRHNSQLKAVIPRNQAVPIMSVILTLSHKTLIYASKPPIKTLTQHTSSHSEAYGDRLAPSPTSSPHTSSHSEAHGVRSTPHSRPQRSAWRSFHTITSVSHHHTRSTSPHYTSGYVSKPLGGGAQ